jgi:predicted TIM-barrel fold metal-dependent hydrolase
MKMPVIDADTHVDECEETWSYMTPAEEKHRPVTLVPGGDVPDGSAPPGYTRHWLVSGALSIRRIRDDQRTGTTLETRELRDVGARLRHMDQMGVDVHILYPTAFLTHITSDAEAQVAICKSYNRWLADKCSQSEGRLRWVAVVPVLDVEAAVAEVHWAAEHGACGVFKLATEVGKRVTDPYFFPIYQAANDTGLGLCMHTGSGDARPGGGTGAFGDGLGNTNMVDAFHGIVFSGLATQFPKLRFGFIEAGASWIPYVLDNLYARRERMSWAFGSFNYAGLNDLFRDNRLYVTCQSHEDIAYLLKFGTEDHLMIGTDYTHADASAEIEAIDGLRRMADEGTIDQTAKRKILEDNPRAFYRL